MSIKKPLPPRDVPWFDPATGRPTEIFFDYIKNLEGRSLGQPVSIAAPVKGQFLVYSEDAAAWTLQPAVAPSNGQVLIWDDINDVWVAGAN